MSETHSDGIYEPPKAEEIEMDGRPVEAATGVY